MAIAPSVEITARGLSHFAVQSVARMVHTASGCFIRCCVPWCCNRFPVKDSTSRRLYLILRCMFSLSPLSLHFLRARMFAHSRKEIPSSFLIFTFLHHIRCQLPVTNTNYLLTLTPFMYDLISGRSESNSPKPGPKPQPKHVIQITRPDRTDKRYCSAVDRSLME